MVFGDVGLGRGVSFVLSMKETEESRLGLLRACENKKKVVKIK